MSPTTPVPTVSPTSSERLEEFLNSLESISERALLDDHTTPQFEAARWLANNDGARIDPTSSMLDERYLMALTYFATNADKSDQSKPLGFLTETPVCSWNDGTNGVFCENGNVVTKIYLSMFPCLSLPVFWKSPLPLTHIFFSDKLELDGSIPSEIFLLPFLRNLRFGTLDRV
jgi:hypothetical protein